MYLHMYVQSISGMRTTTEWLPLESVTGDWVSSIYEGHKSSYIPHDCISGDYHNDKIQK